MNLQDIRFYWNNGMKYTAIPTLLISVLTFIGVWFKELSLAVNIILVIMGFIAYLGFIFLLGILDYNLGFMGRDVEKSEKLSPKWREQMVYNEIILKELKEIKHKRK